MMFSGTMPEDAKKVARNFLNNPKEIIIHDNEKIVLNGLKQFYRVIPEKKKIGELFKFLDGGVEFN